MHLTRTGTNLGDRAQEILYVAFSVRAQPGPHMLSLAHLPRVRILPPLYPLSVHRTVMGF